MTCLLFEPEWTKKKRGGGRLVTHILHLKVTLALCKNKNKTKQNWRWSLMAASFNKEINSVVKTNFFQMRALAKIKNVLPSADFEKVIHAFISSGLDYCNSLYFVISQALLCCLQRMQQLDCCQAHVNETIFPLFLASLHWCPVTELILRFYWLFFLNKWF